MDDHKIILNKDFNIIEIHFDSLGVLADKVGKERVHVDLQHQVYKLYFSTFLLEYNILSKLDDRYYNKVKNVWKQYNKPVVDKLEEYMCDDVVDLIVGYTI